MNLMDYLILSELQPEGQPENLWQEEDSYAAYVDEKLYAREMVRGMALENDEEAA